MLPHFNIEGGLPLALARGAFVIGLVATFGSLFYARIVAPPGLQRSTARALRLASLAGLAAALAGALLWLLAQTLDLTGAPNPAALWPTASSLWAVLSGTQFGHLLALQTALLILAAPAVWPAPTLATVLAAAALSAQAWHDHAAAMESSGLLLACTALHVLAAGAWLGSLLPLYLVVSREPPPLAWQAARRYSPLGVACVGTLLATATFQGWVLLGGPTGVVGTAYGWTALLKAMLFGAMLLLAARNRFVHTPALKYAADTQDATSAPLASLHAAALPNQIPAGQPNPPQIGAPSPQAAAVRPGRTQTIQALGRSIKLETALGLAILLAAGVLTELPPGMHTQPIWPFPYRISLEAVNEDPELRHEAIMGVLAFGVAALVAAVATVLAALKPYSLKTVALRGSVALAGIAAACVAAPHLDLLFVPASPTEYYTSPTGFSAEAIVHGAGLFAQNCVRCHGAEGRGDGPAAQALNIPPADLTAAHLWMHSDGELFGWLAHGMAAPDGSPAMPGFAATLSDDDRWDLIDAIRARNAGLTVDSGKWGRVIRAPAFQALCADGQTRQLAAFSGQVVRLVIDAPAAPIPGLITIATAPILPAPGLCVAQDRNLGRAYAVASGLPHNAAGAVFLIDAQGLLRRVWPSGQAPATGPALADAVTDIKTHKAETAMEEGATMQMDDSTMSGMKM